MSATGVTQRLRSWRPLLLLALAVVAVATLIVVLTPRPSPSIPLSPTSPGPSGSKAIATVLDDRGVRTEEVTRYADLELDQVRDRTILVVDGQNLPEGILTELRQSARRVVLLQPSAANLEDLDLPLTVTQANTTPDTEPDCSWPAAVNAGPTELDGVAFRAAAAGVPGVTGCYPVATPGPKENAEYAAHTIAVVDSPGSGEIVLLGSDSVLRNDSVGEPGRAALGLWSLGSQPELLWWRVSSFDPALQQQEEQDPTELLPAWFGRVHWWLLLVGLLAVLWAGRRFGRLVPEPLPVVVRSAETARGRAALYRQARAHGQAGTVLRADALRRLAARLGVPPTASAAEVCAAVASATGLPLPELHHLLSGPPPGNDAELLTLHRDLDRLLVAADADPSSRSTRKAPS